MIELRTSAYEVISLLNEAKRDGPPLSLDAGLVGEIEELLPACQFALATARINRIESVFLPNDVMGIIFSFCTGRRPTAVWQRDATGALRAVVGARVNKMDIPCADYWKQSIPTLRCVCVQWARVAGTLVNKIRAPKTYSSGPIALAAVFPNVGEIRTWSRTLHPSQQAQFEGVLQEYARLGTLVAISDVRRHELGCDSFPLINLHGLFFKCYWPPGEARHVNQGMASPAWPCKHDHKKLYAAFEGDAGREHYAAALVRAHCVEFQSLRDPLLYAGKFRARVICFNLISVNVDGLNTERWFKTSVVRDLFRPERWEDGLPDVAIINAGVNMNCSPVDIKTIEAMVAPIVPHVFTNFLDCLDGWHPRVSPMWRFKHLVC